MAITEIVVVLPAPFGPEQAEHLARADLEAQTGHRLDGAVFLAQVDDAQCRRGRATGSGM